MVKSDNTRLAGHRLNVDKESLETKSIKIHAHLTTTNSNYLARFSPYTKLIRITAYLQRFSHNF